MSELPRALFVCVQNAGRSQMAHAFWTMAGGPARSAGSAPASSVHPEVVEVMREVGVDLAGRVPRGLTVEDAEWADIVVTMGCGDACPFLRGRATWIGSSPTPMGRVLTRCARSATRYGA